MHLLLRLQGHRLLEPLLQLLLAVDLLRIPLDYLLLQLLVLEVSKLKNHLQQIPKPSLFNLLVLPELLGKRVVDSHLLPLRVLLSLGLLRGDALDVLHLVALLAWSLDELRVEPSPRLYLFVLEGLELLDKIPVEGLLLGWRNRHELEPLVLL